MKYHDTVAHFFGKFLQTVRHLFDFRSALLLISSYLLLTHDPKNIPVANTIYYSFVVMVAIAGLTHVIRKIIFRYLSLEVTAEKAIETPVGAAIVFLSVSLVFCTLIWGTVTWSR